jgi:hypothetical protein
LTAALKSVQGVKVVSEPKPAAAQARRASTVAVIEVADAAALKAVKAAVEGANTPHKGQNAPTIALCAEGKTDAATPMAVRQAVQSGALKRVEL